MILPRSARPGVRARGSCASCAGSGTRYDTSMKRVFVWLIAILSGVYLVVPLPWFTPADPVPFVDEGVALMIFLKATSWLGYDLRRWLPFLHAKAGKRQGSPASGVTIDV